jgi:glycosyltransferase involved in cell wall biosynthesis
MSEGLGASRSVLVWLAEVPFEGAPHRQQHLAQLLSDDYDVVYLEPPPAGRVPRPGLRHVDSVRVGQIAPLLNAHPLRRVLGWRPARRLATLAACIQLLWAALQARVRRSRPIVIVSNVYLIAAVGALDPRLLIVDICDDPRYYPGEPPWSAELLERAVRVADVVTTSSRALELEFMRLGARHVVYVPNGVSDVFLQHPPKPPAGKINSTPVLGFVGHIGPWIDFDLLEQVAQSLPNGRLDLVGSVAPEVRWRLDTLLDLPNVQHRSPVPHADVPEVLSRFDIGLIPFVISPYTRAVNPIKLYEYAALNLPIVTTAFSPDLDQFKDVIAVGATAAAFVDAVREIVDGHRPQLTRPLAEAHTWQHARQAFIAILAGATYIK